MEYSTSIALAALAVAVVSASFTGINARRAKASLNHQRNVDDRAREFRDVSWGSTFDRTSPGADTWVFTIANTGLTTAVKATLVVATKIPEMYEIGTIAAGESRAVTLSGGGAWRDGMQKYLPVSPGFRIFWSSPKGEPGQDTHPAVQLFT